MSENFERALDRYHRALNEFVKGDSEPFKAMYSHRDDVSLANPWGPARRGWKAVAEALDQAATHFRDGQAVGFEDVTTFVTPELACCVEVERYRIKLDGRPNPDVVTLRVTSIARPEGDGTWKFVHRHADPITTPRSADSLISG